jgi:hypothetical protein
LNSGLHILTISLFFFRFCLGAANMSYSLRPIILFSNIDVSRCNLAIHTSILAKSYMGQREYQTLCPRIFFNSCPFFNGRIHSFFLPNAPAKSTTMFQLVLYYNYHISASIVCTIFVNRHVLFLDLRNSTIVTKVRVESGWCLFKKKSERYGLHDDSLNH